MAYFEVEKSRVYKPGERYNSGEGFSGCTQDENTARQWFANFSHQYPGDHEHSVELRRDGEVIETSGPPIYIAHASMHAAYALRRRAAPFAA